MRESSSLLDKLGTFRISDHGGSWIRMILKSFWVLSRVWIMSEFFWTFCNRILRDFKFIVDSRCSLLNGWILTCSHGSQNISSSTTPYWNSVARRWMHLSWLDNHHGSYSIWMWGQGSPFFISSLGGLILSFTLQHHSNSLWFSDLWEPLHLTHLEPYILHEKVVWPYF